MKNKHEHARSCEILFLLILKNALGCCGFQILWCKPEVFFFFFRRFHQICGNFFLICFFLCILFGLINYSDQLIIRITKLIFYFPIVFFFPKTRITCTPGSVAARNALTVTLIRSKAKFSWLMNGWKVTSLGSGLLEISSNLNFNKKF